MHGNSCYAITVSDITYYIMESSGFDSAKWLAQVIKKKAIKAKELKKLKVSSVLMGNGVKFTLTKDQKKHLRNSNPMIVLPSSDLTKTQHTSRPQTSNVALHKKTSSNNFPPAEPAANAASLIAAFQRNSLRIKPLLSKPSLKTEREEKGLGAHHLRNATMVTASELASRSKNWHAKRRAVKLVLRQLWKLVAALLDSDAVWPNIHRALEAMGSNINDRLVDFMFPKELKLYYYDLPDPRARTILESNDLSLSLKYLGNFLASNEGYLLQVKLCECLCYFNVGKYAEAVDSARDLLKKYPGNCYVLYSLAVFYFKVHEWMTCCLTCSKYLEAMGNKELSSGVSEMMIAVYQMKCICNFQMGYVLDASEDYMNASRMVRTRNFQQSLQPPNKRSGHVKTLTARLNFDTQIVLESARSGLVNEADKDDLLSLDPQYEALVSVRNSKLPRKNTIAMPLLARQRTVFSIDMSTPRTSKRSNDQSTTGLRTPRSGLSTFGAAVKQRGNAKSSFAPVARVEQEQEKEEVKETSTIPLSIVDRHKRMNQKRLEEYAHTKSRIEKLEEKLNSSGLLKDNPKSMIQGSMGLENISNLRSFIGVVFSLSKHRTSCSNSSV